MKIFKYLVPFKEVVDIELPLGAKIIRFDGVDGHLFLWAIVNEAEDHPKEKRTLYLFKTGSLMPEDIVEEYDYIGCGGIFVQMELMMYVFEKKRSNYISMYDYQNIWANRAPGQTVPISTGTLLGKA